MKTSLKTLKGLNRSLIVELPIATFTQKIDKILQKMQSTANIDGFRKGKVPLSMLRARFGENAKTDAVNEIVNETLVEALEQVKATPAGRPNISNIDSKDKDNFSYTLEFEVYPQIKIADFSKVKVEQIRVKITQADEDKTLQGLIEQSTEYKAVKRIAKTNDEVNIDFKGLIDGETFKGNEAKDFKLVLGKGSMIKGFEAGLLGISAGKTTNLSLKFPKDYHLATLAGRAVNFEVLVKQVSEPKTPELNDEFAKKFGEKNMDALKKSIKQQMQIEVDNQTANINKDTLFGALLAVNDFEVPQSSVDAEAQNLLEEMNQRMEQQGMPAKDNLPAKAFNQEAQRRVQLGLLIAQISDEYKLSANKEQIDAKLQEMSRTYGENAQQMINHYKQDPAKLKSIELLVVEKMAEDVILAKAKISIKDKKFEEITQQTA